MRPTPLFDEHSLLNGLASHQLDALTWVRHRRVALIADATGSGKTAVAAATIAYAFDEEGAQRAIWVTEANLVFQAVRELRRFLPTLQVSAWPGCIADDVRVISLETLTRHVDAVVQFAAEFGVIDDASVKGEGPEPAAVMRVMRRARRRLGLNATPVELDATEAYRILRVLGAPDLPEESVFHSYMHWQDLPFGEQRPYGTRPEAVQVVREVFARYVLCRGPEELGLRLPQLQTETVWVPLTPPQWVAYQRAGYARSALARSTKREKACAFAAGRSGKAEAAVARVLADPSLSKVVMFAENLAHLSIAEQLLDDAGIGWVRIDGPRSKKQRATALDRFKNDPQVRVLLANRVSERGLDGLQHCGVLFSLGSTFNPAREDQRIGRLRRQGSPHAVVRHVTFATATDHEQRKHDTVERRAHERTALLHGLSATSNTQENTMLMSEIHVQALLRDRRWLRPPSPYGTPLEEVVSKTNDMYYLEAAVLAGHLPQWDGLELAMQATLIDMEAEVRSQNAEPGATPGLSTMSEEYRKLAADLSAAAERLEALGAEASHASG